MKYSVTVALVSLMLFVYANAEWSPFLFENKYDMLEYMRDEDHFVYILFIYNSDQGSPENIERMRKIVFQERDLIKDYILDVFDNLKYTELDLAGGQWDDVIETIGVDVEDALEYPIVVAVDDGLGKWVHGPDLVQLAAPVVRALVERNK